MKDSFADPGAVPASSDASRRDALHALGSLYVRQGFPKQGLALLLAARRFADSSVALNSATAHAYLLAGSPKKSLALLEALAPAMTGEQERAALSRLRARALLALGRTDEARTAFRGQRPQSDAARSAPLKMVNARRRR